MGWVTDPESGELVYEPDNGGGDETKTRTVTVGGRILLINAATGDTIRDLGPAGTPKATEPDQNLGAGVFADARGYYVLDKTGSSPTDVQKRYITKAEANQATSLPGGSSSDATAAGNLSARYAEMAQRQAEFNAELELSKRELEEQLAENARQLALQNRILTFDREKAEFAQSQDETRLALEAQAQVFAQETAIAGLQFNAVQLQAQYANINAQMQNEANQFNASMGFNVQQANQQAAAGRRNELAQNARDVSGYSASPTDWGRLAAFETAGSAWGTEDSRMQEGEFITDKSLQPLAQGLSNRDRILASPENPYSFTPISAPQVAMPDLSFLNQVVKPTTPLVQSGNSGGYTNEAQVEQPAPRTLYSAAQEQQAAGASLPDWVMQTLKQSAGVPKMEQGGITQGAFIAGDSSDGKENEEIIIPLSDGVTMIVPKKGKKGKNLPKYETGGIFDSGLFSTTDTTKARQFQQQAAQRARVGTPWATGPLPGATFASSPGVSEELIALIASLRGLEFGESQDYFRNRAAKLRPAAVSERVIGRTA